MKKIYTLFVALFFVIIVSAQPCPDSLYLTSQAQIDSFQILYPNCTEIEGDVVIVGDDITNLSGLIKLTSIGGDLYIGRYGYGGNPNLLNLDGLDSLVYINGHLEIIGNHYLTSLMGLESLTSIGGDLLLYESFNLTSLTGLANLTSIGNRLIIDGSLNLTSLTGLANLTSIGSSLTITGCFSLTSLTGLENLTGIPGDLSIIYNDSLTSLIGLDNLTFIGGDLTIGFYGGSGNSALISLTGLNNVTSIGGRLWIVQNSALTSLTGLNNVTSIGGELVIDINHTLINLEGLNNLTSIGNALVIAKNISLMNLFDLENLTSIGGNLSIFDNDALTSLTGINNINPSSIEDLSINSNTSLSECEVLSVCEYLAAPNGTVDIYNNAIGCNNPEEVLDSCEAHAGIIDVSMVDRFLMYPNPTNSSITIELPTRPSKNTTLSISNTNGQQLITQPITKPQTEIDISHLPVGIYIIKVSDDKDVMVQKVIKQ
jgi:hypothetical protein